MASGVRLTEDPEKPEFLIVEFYEDDFTVATVYLRKPCSIREAEPRALAAMAVMRVIT